ncbi:MAG: hypothetical protein ISS01_00785, partial [Nanoarchaeota archaeon]|nr:hypothetical protein [Nanoarchaeota archaeon]
MYFKELISGKEVYHEDIISSEYFSLLFSKEKVLFKLKTKIFVKYIKPKGKILIDDNKGLKINKGDVLLVRLQKNEKIFQFVVKIYDWNTFYVPKNVVRTLGIKNKDILNFYVIGGSNSLTNNFKSFEYLDLLDLFMKKNSVYVIKRAFNYLSLYFIGKGIITVPRYIKLDSIFFELIYLVHGDGHYITKLSFTNKEVELHNFVLNSFNSIFGVPFNVWKALVQLKSGYLESKAKDYWLSNTILFRSQFYNCSFTKFNTSKDGNLRIIIEKKVYGILFKEILKELSFDYDNFNIHSLNGLYAAEGSASLGKKGLHKIILSFNDHEKYLFKYLLDDLGFNYKISQGKNYVIENWKNLYLFFRIFHINKVIPFRLHTLRREKAVNGFLEHSKSRIMVKYLSNLRKLGKIPTNIYAKTLRIR